MNLLLWTGVDFVEIEYPMPLDKDTVLSTSPKLDEGNHGYRHCQSKGSGAKYSSLSFLTAPPFIMVYPVLLKSKLNWIYLMNKGPC